MVELRILEPTVMALVQIGLARTGEYDGDRAAEELNGDTEGLMRALSKLERRVGRFWEEIFLPGRRIHEPSLLRTHPSTESRIARLRELTALATPQYPTITGMSYKPRLPSFLPPKFRRHGVYW